MTGKLQNLVDTPEYLLSNRLGALPDDDIVITGGGLDYYEIGEYDVMQQRVFEAEDAETIRQALLEDAAAGRMDRIDLMGYQTNDDKDRYANTVSLNYHYVGNRNSESAYITLNANMTSTIQALEDLGILNEYVTLRLESEQNDYYAQQEMSYEEEAAAVYAEEIPATADVELAA